MADNIKTYDAGRDVNGNPRFMVVNESRKWYDDEVYAISRQGIVIQVKYKAELKKIKDALIKKGNKDKGENRRNKEYAEYKKRMGKK